MQVKRTLLPNFKKSFFAWLCASYVAFGAAIPNRQKQQQQRQKQQSSAEEDLSALPSPQLQLLLAAVALVTLVAAAFYLYRRLYSSTESTGHKTAAVTAQHARSRLRRVGNATEEQQQQQGRPYSTVETLRRRRALRDRASLEEFLASGRTDPYTAAKITAATATAATAAKAELAAKADPAAKAASTATTAIGEESVLVAAQRSREAREARLAERRQQQQELQQQQRNGSVFTEQNQQHVLASEQLTRDNTDFSAPLTPYETRQLAREKERQKRAAEEWKQKQEQDRREESEYNTWKARMVVTEEGEAAAAAEDDQLLVQRFVAFLQKRKVCDLQDAAAEFSLSVKEVVLRIRALMASGRLKGILDDRGFFVHITDAEFKELSSFLHKCGRIHVEKDLLPACQRIISVQPSPQDKLQLDRERRAAMNLLFLSEDDTEE